MKTPAHCCKNCHFLTKNLSAWQGGEGYSNPWTQDERDSLSIDLKVQAPACQRGIWDAGIDPNLQFQLSDILTRNRRDDCFFIEFRPGMSYQAATELHRIRNDNRQLKRSYRYTRIALGVAAAGIVLNFVWNIVTHFF